MSDDASVTRLASTPLLQGWSARLALGVSRKGLHFSFGGEFGGIGNDYNIWTLCGRISMPF
jgi:hypothetical protein